MVFQLKRRLKTKLDLKIKYSGFHLDSATIRFVIFAVYD